MSKFLYIIGVFILHSISGAIGDICSTCLCFNTAEGSTIDCHDKHLGRNDVLNLDLLMLDEHQALNTLLLSRNSIVYLPNSILKNNKRLKSLDLSQNFIENVHAAAFADLHSLRDLNFSMNRLSSFDNILLQILPALSQLNLSYNNISTVGHTIRENAEELISLDLSHNRISELSKGFIESLPNLQYLDLSFNDIRFLNESFVQLRSLKTFYINNNHLRSLNLQMLPTSLIQLHCGFNVIDKVYYITSAIEILNIEYNRISKIEENVTSLNRLQHLNISGNELSELPETVFERLKILDLSANKFLKVPEPLSSQNFPRLRELNVSHNSIRNLMFASELRLRSLVANYNLLERIEKDTFSKLFTPSNDCINLTISRNTMLHYINEEALKHLNVCYLDLSYNRISDISQKLISLEFDFKTYAVNLQGNPFNCNCSLQWMINVLVPKLFSTRPNLLDDLRCASPPQISNTRMVHWYKWKQEIFCVDMSDRLESLTAEVSSRQFVMIKFSPGLLVAVAASTAALVILVFLGILLTWKASLKKRRMNRRL